MVNAFIYNSYTCIYNIYTYILETTIKVFTLHFLNNTIHISSVKITGCKHLTGYSILMLFFLMEIMSEFIYMQYKAGN